MNTSNPMTSLMETAARIKEMREILNFSIEEMAEKTEVSVEEYVTFETGKSDFPFTFIHKCAIAFGIDITALIEGRTTHLVSSCPTNRGMTPVDALKWIDEKMIPYYPLGVYKDRSEKEAE